MVVLIDMVQSPLKSYSSSVLKKDECDDGADVDIDHASMYTRRISEGKEDFEGDIAVTNQYEASRIPTGAISGSQRRSILPVDDDYSFPTQAAGRLAAARLWHLNRRSNAKRGSRSSPPADNRSSSASTDASSLATIPQAAQLSAAQPATKSTNSRSPSSTLTIHDESVEKKGAHSSSLSSSPSFPMEAKLNPAKSSPSTQASTSISAATHSMEHECIALPRSTTQAIPRAEPIYNSAAASEEPSGSMFHPSTVTPQSSSDATDIDLDHVTSNDEDYDDTNLDYIATRTEEKYVMRRLFQNIEDAKNARKYVELYPHLMANATTSVATVATGGNRADGEKESDAVGGWKTAPTPGPHQQVLPWGKRRTYRGYSRYKASKAKTVSRVRETILLRRKIRQSLPKWIPCESGKYSSEADSPSLLFTRPHFVKYIVIEVDKGISNLGWEHRTWTATLSDNNPMDPQSYLLEAEGTEEVIDIVLEKTQAFVREEIERINLERLVSNGASLLVDMTCKIDLKANRASQAFGAIFSSIQNNTGDGVYIKSIQPKGVLAKKIGDEHVFNNGCALLAINKKKVSDLFELEKLLNEVKSECLYTESSSYLEITLCLSKYADLSEAPNTSKWKIYRNDGLPYDEEDYVLFRVNRFLEWGQKQESLRLKTRNKKDKKESKEESEEECSSEDEETFTLDNNQASSSEDDYSSSRKLSGSKKRKKEGNKKRQKRRKQKRKAILSDSESDIDATSFAIADEDSDQEEIVRKKPKKLKKNEILNDTETSEISKEKKENGRYVIFRRFEAKVKPLISRDYKDTNITLKRIYSSMWNKYKEFFGDDACGGDTCDFLIWLPKLVHNVIKDHVVREKKRSVVVETEKELEKRTLGICKNFVPKFVHKLKDQYPNENETQLIERLVGMWDSHQRNRLYGMQCKPDCTCHTEWDQIFAKGDKAASREFLSMMKRSSLLSQSMQSSANQAAPSGPIVPRKKRVGDLVNEQKSNKKIIQRKKTKLIGLISSMSFRLDMIEVAFKTSIPIGGYFRTRNDKCLVFSIYMNGQMAKDKRITKGITVVSVKTSGNHVAISSHSEFQKFYDNARKTKDMIHVSFSNQGMKSFDHTRINKFWTNTGEWVGSANLDEHDGWAGGALTAPKPKPPKRPREENENHLMHNMTNVRANPPALVNQDTKGLHENMHIDFHGEVGNTTNASTHGLNIEQWTTIVNTKKPEHRNREPEKTLLIPPEKSSFLPEEDGIEEKGLNKLLNLRIKTSKRARKHSKVVKISISNNKEMYFCKNDASNVRRILQVKSNFLQDTLKENTPQFSDPEKALLNAFRSGSCNDVLDVLEAQEFLTAVSEGRFDVESVLQSEYIFVGHELKTINELKKKNDLKAKYTILKIYINCLHLIEKTMSLKKWYEVTIELKYIDLQQNHTIADDVGGSVTVILDDGHVKEDFGQLPVQKFGQHISYNGKKLKYTSHNNRSFPFEKRSFVIDLKKGSFSNSFVPPRSICSFNIDLDDIEGKCLPQEQPSEFIESLSNNSFHEISGGHVTINASKKGATKEYIMIKKLEIIRKLRVQLEYMEQFNQDPTTPPGARLTANISGMGGRSILHAAIILLDDEELVKRMLRLGANPRSCISTDIGTPLNLAQRNLHSAIEKEKNIRLKGLDSVSHVQRCNRARVLVGVLQDNVFDPPAIMIRPKSMLKPVEKSAEIEQNVKSQAGDAASSSMSQPESSFNTQAHNKATEGQETDLSIASKIPSKRPLLHTAISDLAPVPKITPSKIHPPPASAQCSAVDHSTSIPIVPTRAALDIAKISPLPKTIRVDWLTESPVLKYCTFCTNGPKCRFCKQNRCRYWHNEVAPKIRAKSLFPSLPEQVNMLPNLNESEVEFKTKYANNNKKWWTAAYVSKSSKSVLYVHKVLESSGFQSFNGVVWFPTEHEAVYSLRCTVFLLQKPENKDLKQMKERRGSKTNQHLKRPHQYHHRQQHYSQHQHQPRRNSDHSNHEQQKWDYHHQYYKDKYR